VHQVIDAAEAHLHAELSGQDPLGVDAAERADSQRPFLLDVRTAKEFSAGSIPGAVNIPIDELRFRLKDIPRDRAIAAYCQVGRRGYLATRILRQSGFSASSIRGGYETFRLFHPSNH
jgi:rhodanese-related sulfurtransferase